MLARIFRWLDRLGWVTVRLGAWLGLRVNAWAQALGVGGRRSAGKTGSISRAERIESQVRSLSGLTIGLLAAVLVLILWATSSAAGDNPVVSFLNLNPTPIPSGEGNIDPQDAGGIDFFGSGGALVFTGRSGGQNDLFALTVGQEAPVRLTNSPADDRDPAWSPDGRRLAFASRRDGNWEIYLLDMPTGELTRLTYDLAFEAGPSWSPDGQWLAYEGYFENNLDIYIIKVDGSESSYRLTYDLAPDFSPAWTTAPEGREIAYVSWRDGNQEIYALSLDDPSEDAARNLTNTPETHENHPDWGPGGYLIAYSAIRDGVSLSYVLSAHDPEARPIVVSQGREPTWSPSGEGLLSVTDHPDGDLLLVGLVSNWGLASEAYAVSDMAITEPDWTAIPLPATLEGSLSVAATTSIEPAYQETVADVDPPYQLSTLAGVIADSPWLSDRVNDSFIALRERIRREAGWDFLERLDGVWWPLERRPEPGQEDRNWHKAGRAFDIVQDYNQGSPAQIELVREDVGVNTYWRLYVRAAVQDGTLGEPLRTLPWDFAARTDVDAYEEGGQLRAGVPTGYYVDFTLLAADYGWERTPSHDTWRYNWPGVLYWQYENRGGLDSWSAMQELYPAETLEETLAPPTPVPTPTPAPTSTLTLTPTETPGASSSEPGEPSE